MTGPVTLYHDMTSGDPGRIATVRDDTSAEMRRIFDAAESVRYAKGLPDWQSPEGRTAFNARAWATEAAAQNGYHRLNRVEIVVRAARAGYTAMVADATPIINRWHREKDLPRNQNLLGFLALYLGVMNDLLSVRSTYETVLSNQQAWLDTAGMWSSEDPDAEATQWLLNGLKKSLVWDLNDPSTMGPIIPNIYATGAGTDNGEGATPQGLGYDPRTGYLLQTSYEKDGDGHDVGAQLNIIDPDTGELINTVNLTGGDGTIPSHLGAVSVTPDGKIVISSSGTPGEVIEYDRSKVFGQPVGTDVAPSHRQDVQGGAFSTIGDDGHLYTGTYYDGGKGPGALTEYKREGGRWVQVGHPHPIPDRVQGIAVHDGKIVFSRSGVSLDNSAGKHAGSTLETYDLRHITSNRYVYDTIPGRQVDPAEQKVAMPNMAEGTVYDPRNGSFYTVLESGSHPYMVKGDEATWASQRMIRTPGSELGFQGSGTLDVDPVSLHRAKDELHAVEQAMDRCSGRVKAIHLDAADLGKVNGASSFAGSVNSYLTTTGEWIDECRISAGIGRQGLVDAALTYARSDEGTAMTMKQDEYRNDDH